MRRLYKPLYGLLLFCAVTQFAWGHTRLLRSIPQSGAVVKSPPAAVWLVFSAPPESRFSRIQLRIRGQWQNLPVKQDEARLSARLPALLAGQYWVRWRVLSRDGHSQDGKLVFTVR